MVLFCVVYQHSVWETLGRDGRLLPPAPSPRSPDVRSLPGVGDPGSEGCWADPTGATPQTLSSWPVPSDLSSCPQRGLNFRGTVPFREKVPLQSPGGIIRRLKSKNQIQNRAGGEIRSRTSVPLRNSRPSFIHSFILIHSSANIYRWSTLYQALP